MDRILEARLRRLLPLVDSPELRRVEDERDATRAADRIRLLAELAEVRRGAEKASATRARELAEAEKAMKHAEAALRDAKRQVRALYSRNFGLDHAATLAVGRIEARLASLGEDSVEEALVDVGRIAQNARRGYEFRELRARDWLGRWRHDGFAPSDSNLVAHAEACDALIDELKALRESPLSPAEIEARCLGARRFARAGLRGERPLEEVLS